MYIYIVYTCKYLYNMNLHLLYENRRHTYMETFEMQHVWRLKSVVHCHCMMLYVMLYVMFETQDVWSHVLKAMLRCDSGPCCGVSASRCTPGCAQACVWHRRSWASGARTVEVRGVHHPRPNSQDRKFENPSSTRENEDKKNSQKTSNRRTEKMQRRYGEGKEQFFETFDM